MLGTVVRSKMEHELSSGVKVFAAKMAEVVLAHAKFIWDSLEVVGIYLCAVGVLKMCFHVLRGSVAPTVFTVMAIFEIAASEKQLGICMVLVAARKDYSADLI